MSALGNPRKPAQRELPSSIAAATSAAQVIQRTTKAASNVDDAGRDADQRAAEGSKSIMAFFPPGNFWLGIDVLDVVDQDRDPTPPSGQLKVAWFSALTNGGARW